MQRYLHPDERSLTEVGDALTAHLSVRRSPGRLGILPSWQARPNAAGRRSPLGARYVRPPSSSTLFPGSTTCDLMLLVTFSLPSRGMEVAEGLLRRSRGLQRLDAVTSFGVVVALCCCTTSRNLNRRRRVGAELYDVCLASMGGVCG